MMELTGFFSNLTTAPCFLRYLYHLPHDSVLDLPDMAGGPSKSSAQPALNPYTSSPYAANLPK